MYQMGMSRAVCFPVVFTLISWKISYVCLSSVSELLYADLENAMEYMLSIERHAIYSIYAIH